MERLALIAITDLDRVPADVLLARAERLARFAEPGTVAVQLRDRERSARTLFALGTRLRALTAAAGQLFIVNDRLDLALLLRADALHLGERSVVTADARRLWGSRPVFRACHDSAELRGLDAEGAVLSPVLAPRKGNPALGLRALGAARAALDHAARNMRLFALGGVDAATAAACVAAGAHGVAAIGAAFDVDDASPLLRALGIERKDASP